MLSDNTWDMREEAGMKVWLWDGTGLERNLTSP